ncbi:MAG: SpoIIE family protein phosphatase, partial [Pseudobdellovibrionaceae bacterium]|nr:SpoIIE family protein phosphatase [Pseudobdellovibrionaceae bacterium]
DLLQRGQYGALTADVSKILHKVKSLSASLKMQVNDILELAKSQKGQLRGHCSRFSVHDLVDDITVLAEGLALKARLTTFEVQIQESGDVAQSFVSDYEKLLASVRNLVSNAFKFRKRNESNHVLIRFEYTGEQLHVVVRDQGIGLNPEDFDRIFDEFAQVEDDSRRAYEGTGLGLALAAKYVGLLQGQIKLQSEPGQGSCFTLSIPNQRRALPEVPLLARDIPHATVVPTAWSEGPPSIVMAGPVSQESGKEGRILIVDDNAANGEIFSAILQSFGYSILYVMSGQEALEVLPSFQPDLILLDMMMPEFSGDDVLCALRQHAEFRKVPVIVVTARAHDDDRIQALKAGADEYLPKPILPEELLLRVENVLARHTLVREMVQKAILRGELEAARQVQQALVDNALVIPGLQFGSFYKPADESGGDWFGALYEPERSLVFLFMGDVTGHGISSALLTGVVHGAIKGIFHYATLRNQNLALQEFMIQLAQATDRTLLDLANRTERWMTMAFIGIDLKNGQGLLVNAGHQVVYHIRDNKPKPLLCFGNPLGTGRVLNPQVLTFDFHDGDRLFLYTDGLMETGDEQRPVRRLKSLEDLLASCDEGEPLIQAILSRFNDLQQSHRVDDVSILHVKRVAHEDSRDKPIANVS